MDIRIALAGNPNSGKTTLFNALTGSNQFVGNWPGVTVEKKEGKLKKHDNVVIMDLPGIYSLSPYTLEEVVARNYLVGERPDAILNIIDGTNLERNLYLTAQLIEMRVPMLVVVNMLDVAKQHKIEIRLNELEKALGCPVVGIVASRSSGISELKDRISEFLANPVVPPMKIRFDERITTCIDKLEAELKAGGQRGKRIFADDGGADLGQVALVEIGVVPIDIVRDDHRQHRVAEEFQPLVAGVLHLLRFVGIGGVPKRVQQQLLIAKGIADRLFQPGGGIGVFFLAGNGCGHKRIILSVRRFLRRRSAKRRFPR